MSIPSSTLFDEIERRFQSIDRIRTKVTKLHDKGVINIRETHLIVESLYLNAHSAFENFLERLFIGLMSGTYVSSMSGTRPKVPFKSVAIARQVLREKK